MIGASLGSGMEWSLWSVFFVLVGYGLIFTGIIFAVKQRNRKMDKEKGKNNE